jgi:hypothetical protein
MFSGRARIALSNPATWAIQTTGAFQVESAKAIEKPRGFRGSLERSLIENSPGLSEFTRNDERQRVYEKSSALGLWIGSSRVVDRV